MNVSTRPDDDSTDKPSEEEADKPAPDGQSREDRVRGGFFQSDIARRFAAMRGGEDGAGKDGQEAPGFGRRPPKPPRTRDKGDGGPRRWSPRQAGPLTWTLMILAVGAGVILFFSQTWTEVLWFSQLGFARVIWTEWIASSVTFVVGFLLMFAALVWAIRSAYRSREIELPQDEAARNLEAYRTAVEPIRGHLTWGLPAVLALFTAATTLAPSWREFLLAMHSTSFGVKDPQFGLDMSFYVFILPALSTLVGFLSRVIVFAGVASAVVHYLYGGISVTRSPHFTRAARRHLAVFLAIFSLLQGTGYWLGRYEALYASNAKFDGAGYTDVHAVIPADAILAAICIALAVLFMISVRARSWKLPVTGVVVMIVSALLVGTGYPMVVQRFVVDPNAQRQEAPYIQRNIQATLAAYGLDAVQATDYAATTTAEAGQLLQDAESTTSIRLLDPNLVAPTFKQLQQNKQYYSFSSSLNVDRYVVDGTHRDTVIAVRELNLSGVGDSQRTWINEHTVYTHGYGVVAAYGNTAASGGYPSFWEGGIPSTGDLGDYEPRIYFGQSSPSYKQYAD